MPSNTKEYSKAYYLKHKEEVRSKQTQYYQDNKEYQLKYHNPHRFLVDVKPDEVVHHLDHNHTNNDVSNLMVMTRSDHMKYHQLHRFGKTDEAEEVLSKYTN